MLVASFMHDCKLTISSLVPDQLNASEAPTKVAISSRLPKTRKKRKTKEYQIQITEKASASAPRLRVPRAPAEGRLEIGEERDNPSEVGATHLLKRSWTRTRLQMNFRNSIPSAAA